MSRHVSLLDLCAKGVAHMKPTGLQSPAEESVVCMQPRACVAFCQDDHANRRRVSNGGI